MWRRVTIPVKLTDEQDAVARARASSRHGVVPFEEVKARPRGVEIPGLGFVRYARPALVHLWPRTVRLLHTANGYFIEYTARSVASIVTSPRLIIAVMAVLSFGVGVSALTTKDQAWWLQAFSRLGVFDDFSSFMFNGGLILAGAVACVFASRLWLDLARLRRRGFPAAAAIVVPALCVLAATSMSMVGLFTETGNRPVHDLSAMTLAAAFAGLVLSAPWLLRRLSPRVHVVTGISVVLLFAGVGMFVPGMLSLAAFELLLFGLFFLWLGFVSYDVHRRLKGSRAR